MHRSYQYVTTRLWNNLPDYVTRAPSLNIFKSILDEVNLTTRVECQGSRLAFQLASPVATDRFDSLAKTDFSLARYSDNLKWLLTGFLCASSAYKFSLA